MSTLRPSVVLAAGGTGGHLFPAEALAGRLIAQGASVHLATDRRVDLLARAVPGLEVSQLWAGRLGGGPLKSACGLAELAVGIVQARRLLRRIAADAAVGFGGYPSLPTMLAAAQLGLPAAIHEQNAVLGRANRLLARRATRIATGFADTAGLRAADRVRAVHTGNPVRPAIRALPYRPPAPGMAIALMVLGGSQGARIFADIVPPALRALPPELRTALRLSLQVRPEDCPRVAEELQGAGIAAEVKSFFDDVPERLAHAQLVISRAGASTVAELAAAGRPALLVPYPFAADDHQSANARAFVAAGAGWTIAQSALGAPALADWLAARLADPAGLARAAGQARGFAVDDAAERLAALVLNLCAGPQERAA